MASSSSTDGAVGRKKHCWSGHDVLWADSPILLVLPPPSCLFSSLINWASMASSDAFCHGAGVELSRLPKPTTASGSRVVCTTASSIVGGVTVEGPPPIARDSLRLVATFSLV